MDFDFDALVDRRGTNCQKWDQMAAATGVTAADALPMWVADMDFRPPPAVQHALEGMIDHGLYGYPGSQSPATEAVRWWMRTRHGWDVAPEAILTTHGLVNGTGLCVDSCTEPGEGVVLFTPVYHAFARVIRAAGREVIECPMPRGADGRYRMDLEAASAALPDHARMVMLCSPHNPGGRVWSPDELRAVAEFARRHDLILISDEIHHDLVFPGQTHTAMALAAPGIADRLIMLTAATKTFNIAGAHLGNVIIPDPALRARLERRMAALGISPNAFGLRMVEAAYGAEGAAWVDALMAYLDGNRRLFDAGVNAIPGLASMPLEGTYLAWVDFAGTGMRPDEIAARVGGAARIAASPGPQFGAGGERFMRFNLATQRTNIEAAVARLTEAFGDLQ